MPKKVHAKVKKAQAKMKEAAKMYRAYKKQHPDGKKKITTFVKEVWQK